MSDPMFPPGLFKEGARVRLRRPSAYKHSFDKPNGVMRVVHVLHYKGFVPPTYAIAEEDGLAVCPFSDADLRPAR